ncbi:TonB-dependent receptor [Zhouia spongiae]|uniref:TonB-dependent receptor n=1 Tax=Zhouia spongiae TaxID=2202721 RepID=A0ABY3YLK6_9FLAO|nr:TonB-dependent receptor [Zhouia spongiae]UNY98376.1 TonB-dependent receptor [Zhouia spongiae]
MRLFFTLCICIGFVFAAFSQSGNIKGKVRTSSGEAIPYANVWLENTQKGDVTDQNGSFEIKNIKTGSYKLIVTSVGYRKSLKQIEIAAGTLNVPDIVLTETTESLGEVVVNGKSKSPYLQTKPSSSLKLESKLIDVPQNIQVVSNELINDQLAFSLFDGIARNTSGVRRVMHQTNALMYMRGYSVEGLRNGMNISGYFGPLKDDMSFVDRIEFVKGPAGYMMGNTSLGGLYNVVTKKPTGINKNTLALTLGSFDTYRVEADFDGVLSKDGKLLYRLNLMGKLRGSHTDYGYDNGYVVAPSFKYMIDEDTEVTMEYIYQNNAIDNYANYIYSKIGFKEFPVNTSYSDPRKDPVVMNDHSILVNMKHAINNNWTFTTQANYLNYKQRGTQLGLRYNSLQDDGSATRSFGLLDNDNITLLGQAYLNGTATTGEVSHKIVGGLDMGAKQYYSDWSNLTPYGEETPYNIYDPEAGAANLTTDDFPQLDDNVSLRNRAGRYNQKNSFTALYFHDEIGFFDDKLRLSMAGRYTNTKRIENTGKITKNDVFTPRIGLSYSFVEDGSVYGVFDQTFEENYGLPLEDGTSLKPSKGSNIEFGIKKAWFNERLTTSIAGYQLTKNNLTTTAGVTPDQYSVQFGESQSKGLEIDINGEVLPNLNVVLNYAFTEARITKDTDPGNVGELLPGAAKHISNAWVTYRLPETTKLEGLGISLGYQLQKDRAAWPAGSGSLLPDDYFSLDGGVSYKLGAYNISLLVNNITDNYNYTGFYPGAWGYTHFGWRAAPPRNFKFRVAYSF